MSKWVQLFTFYFISFLLSCSRFFLLVRIFFSSVAPANQGHFSPCMLWSLINIRVNSATDATEDSFRPLYVSILLIQKDKTKKET